MQSPLRFLFSWKCNLSFGTYISSHHKSHKSLTFSFRPLRFAAGDLRVVHGCHPTVCFFFSHPSPCCLGSTWCYETLQNLNYAKLAAARVFKKVTAVYFNILSHEGHLLSKLFTISHQSDLTEIPQRMVCLLLNVQRY